MFVKHFLKKQGEKIPYSIGSILALTPFRYRLGNTYVKVKKLLTYGSFDEYDFSIKRFSEIFEHAKNNFTFYNKLYKKAGVFDLQIKELDDIKKIPVVTKEEIRNHLDEFNGAMLLNTGGTSGEPFSFYVDKNAFAREWAHMHYIWKLKEYNYTDIKVTLRGKDLGEKNIIYNPIHNEFIVNTYKNVCEFKSEIIQLFYKRKIKFLHGYPSAIFNFLKELEMIISLKEKEVIKRNLKTCLFGSEFPMPHITEYIKSDWDLDYISWYGHSEMSILAVDKDSTNNYTPFYTYGFTEVIDNKLIGTSYHNFDMPLIRYDTGDIVEPLVHSNGLLKSFKVSQGRNGDYIIDKKHKNISLTALIFGRHHDVFNFAKFIQVKQDRPGEVIIYITTNEKDPLILNRSLNLNNIDVDFAIIAIDKPFRTAAGKVKLKI